MQRLLRMTRKMTPLLILWTAKKNGRLWLLLALSVFGALFGFVGMLIAVPVAAALGVLARFFAAQYTNSRLYRGLEGSDE